MLNAITTYIIDYGIIADIKANLSHEEVFDIDSVEDWLYQQIEYDRSATHDENSVHFIEGLDAFGDMPIQYDLLVPLFQDDLPIPLFQCDEENPMQVD
jgi:hypothetical protein